MFIRSKGNADHRVRKGLTSYFMFGKDDADQDQLAITWVEVAIGGRQRLHNHPEIQVYVIVAGSGQMQVGTEQRPIQAGDLVFIPSNQMHGIINTGDSVLQYVSAATPAFDLEAAYDRGQLTPDAYA